MGQCVCWIKSKSFCVIRVYLWVSLWKLWSSSSTQKLYLCIPFLGTKGTSRQELADQRLTSCQDLDLMAFWAQLLGRLGTVPRRMCHYHPTAWAVMMWRDGGRGGIGSEEPSFHLLLLHLCLGVLRVFGVSSAFHPLFALKSFCVTAGCSVILLGENCSV